MLSKDFLSITAPIKLLKSSTSPTFILETFSSRFSLIAGHILFAIYARDAAEHFVLGIQKPPQEDHGIQLLYWQKGAQ